MRWHERWYEIALGHFGQFIQIQSDSSPYEILSNYVSRQGWVLFEQTCAFNGIHFTKHFTEFVLVETNQ